VRASSLRVSLCLTLACGGMQCDDGNTLSSDGCSSSCSIEAGFSCAALSGTVADVCTCQLSDPECCVRQYGKCMGSSDESCSSHCLSSLTSCMRAAEGESPGSQGAATWPDLNLTLWSHAAPMQCNQTLIKQCQRDLAACQNTAAQLEADHLVQAAAAAEIPASEAPQCNSGKSSCLDGFVQCMRVTACPAKT